MASLEKFKQITEEDAAAVLKRLDETSGATPSIWSQAAHIEALQTNAAWACASLLQDALINMISIELGLDQVWDSWLEYHRTIGGPITHDTLMKLHNIDYVKSVIETDPSTFDVEFPDPESHYFFYILVSYRATTVSYHSIQSPEQALYLNYYIYIKKHLLDHGYDVPVMVLRELLFQCGIERTLGELEVVPTVEE